MKRKIWLLKDLGILCLKFQLVLPPYCDYMVLNKYNFPEYSGIPYETHEAGTSRQRSWHPHNRIRLWEWTEVWILLFPVESASLTFIQAPLPRLLFHLEFGIIVFCIAAGIQHTETEEIFTALSCTINKPPKIQGKPKKLYGLFEWFFPSRSAEKTGPWYPSDNFRVCMACVSLLQPA